MGEAKRRGSLQERKSQAEKIAEQMRGSFETFQQAMIRPVDVEKFVFLFDVFNMAASGQIPGVDPSENKIDIDGHGTVTFTNNPLNRGLKAVTDELQSMGLSGQGDKAPYVARFCELHSVLSSDRFAKFMRKVDGMVSVSGALVNALATARFISRRPTNDDLEGALGYDLDDLYTKAEAEFSNSGDEVRE